jgi:dUTP pyrophosphatase
MDKFIFLLKSGIMPKTSPFPPMQPHRRQAWDVVAAIDDPIIMNAGDIAMVPTGLSIALRTGYECQVRPRSGLAAKNGVTVLNAPGTVDADYRGEIKVILINHGKAPFTIERGMRIAQLVIARYEHAAWTVCTELDENLARHGRLWIDRGEVKSKLSFRRRPESKKWMPTFVGMTEKDILTTEDTEITESIIGLFNKGHIRI